MSNILRGAIASFAMLAACFSFAAEPAEAESAADDARVDPALQAEIDYVEALVKNSLPDFAEPVIAAAKKKWPEADTMFFAIEVRGLLSMGRFDEATAKIEALPDRNGTKYWAARLEFANSLYFRGRRKESEVIYNDFFKRFSKPAKEMAQTYRNACWFWGQLLSTSSRYDEATQIFEKLLSILEKTRKSVDNDDSAWCNVACDTAEMYIHLAGSAAKPDDKKKYINAAKRLVDKLLWERDRFLVFGRAVAMKANLELLKGDVARAQATIDDHFKTLVEIHAFLKERDPDGKQGLLKQSPIPICRFLLAQMLWKEAQAEFKKPKRDDERVKELLFGAKVGGNRKSKRNGKGAFNHTLNVFMQYPWSSWAAQAGDMNEEIRQFAEKNYGAKIKANVTPELMAKVRAAQFRSADEKFLEGNYDGAVAEYLVALAACPETVDAVRAVENIAMANLNRIARGRGSEAEKEGWRIDADAIEGYLAERFSGLRNRVVMTAGGDAVQRLAALEKERGEKDRAEVLYKAFVVNYDRHANAPGMAASLAVAAMEKDCLDDAIWYLNLICSRYTNSTHYAASLYRLSECYDKLGNRRAAIDCLDRYCSVETAPLTRTQARMSLARLYKNEGAAIMKAAETNETPEAVAAQLTEGSIQIVKAMKQFRDFAKECAEALADASVPPGEKEKYGDLREGALYSIGDCWQRMTKPEGKLETFRKNAAAAFEEYVKAYPRGKYAKAAYKELGTKLYPALGDGEGSKNALARLSKEFPDSPEAKNAMPNLAKSLIKMGMTREGTEIYANMLKTDGAYTAGQFVDAGEALIDAGSWALADQAFEKAASCAGTNQMTTVARARIGQAKSLYRQKSYAEARAQLDLFLADEKMSRLSKAAEANLLLAEIASEQGRTEKNDDARRRHFNAAVGAVKKLRTYWKSKPREELDVIELMSADIVVKRMEAEIAMGLEEQARDTCADAASKFQVFLQTHAPTEDRPASAMTPGELANLERCYSSMIPLFSRLGDDQADRVMKFGAEYLALFPNGKARTEVVNCMNKAKGAVATQQPPDQQQPVAADAASAPADGGNSVENEGGNENE